MSHWTVNSALTTGKAIPYIIIL